MEYSFERRRSDAFGEILEPLVPAKLVGPRLGLSVMMLLDSGADISVIPHSIGRMLGLPFDEDKRREVRGVEGGSLAYILSDVTLELAGERIPARFGWAMIDDVPMILGRLDVFDYFNVEFRQKENRIVVEPS